MKKTILFVIGIALVSMAWSQGAAVQTAYGYMNDGNYVKAQEYIDKAAENAKTSIQAKTWMYRGMIYTGLAMTQISMANGYDVSYTDENGVEQVVTGTNISWTYKFIGKVGDVVKITATGKDAYVGIFVANELFKEGRNENGTAEASGILDKEGKVVFLIIDPKKGEAAAKFMNTSIDSYLKAKKMDVKNRYESEIGRGLGMMKSGMFNSGVQLYNAGEYEDAYYAFNKAVVIGDALENIDTTSLYNAAMAAEKSGKNDTAVLYYKKCISYNYVPYNSKSVSDVYNLCAQVLKRDGKKDEAIKLIKEGRQKYPKSKALIIEELNYYLETGDDDGAEKSLTDALATDPHNPIYYFALGTVYDSKANPVDADGSDLEVPANHDELFNKAIEAYNKAIEINNNYFDALYNLGALYVNEGVRLSKMIETIPDATKMKDIKKQSDQKFCEALPWLEKSLTINQDDKNTLISLKQLYAQMSMAERYQMISDKLKNATPIDIDKLESVDTENNCNK